MFMKNEKKKTRSLFAIGIGAAAVYGAYSMVKCIKDGCQEKAKMLTKVFKKKECKQKCEDEGGEPYD